MTKTQRLDLAVVERGLADTRSRAKALIMAGDVLVNGQRETRAGQNVAPADDVALREKPRFVSRGGEKLDHALEAFGIDVAGLAAADLGASTGGFTDCLLQRGAKEVVAVDVGYGQLHERLRADPRVDGREQTDIRDVTPDAVGGPLDVVVADLSFISLHGVVQVLLGLLAPDGDLVVLVKPQFEAGRQEVSRGRGVIRDPQVWARVLDEVATAFARAGGAIMEAMVSPLRGADGNAEFLVHVRLAPSADAPARLDVGALVAEAAGETS